METGENLNDLNMLKSATNRKQKKTKSDAETLKEFAESFEKTANLLGCMLKLTLWFLLGKVSIF